MAKLDTYSAGYMKIISTATAAEVDNITKIFCKIL